MAQRKHLTATTTRQEFLEDCAKSYAQSATYGGNTAILNHVVQLHNMPDADWPRHRDQLILARSAHAPQIAELARQLVEQ